jgi:ribonuclease BN (tRNA processing enzyme)
VRLTVIGSSPAWPNPGSAHSGYLLEGPGKLLLDCGPGVLARLREGGHVVQAVTITHWHLDHWGDLVPWAWLKLFGRDELPVSSTLYLPPGGIDELTRFASFWGNEHMFERAFNLAEFEPGKPFEAAGFEVEARRVPHYDLEAYGFRVHEPGSGRVLAYSGDCAPTQELAALARGANLFVCEATLADASRDGPPRGHLTAEEALAAADGPILLTHRPIELPPPGGLPLAQDGLTLNV